MELCDVLLEKTNLYNTHCFNKDFINGGVKRKERKQVFETGHYPENKSTN